MPRGKKGKMTKKTQTIIAGLVIAGVVLIGTVLYFQSKNQTKDVSKKDHYSAVNVSEGSISSSTLLSGTVKALSEEYIYFDQSKGTNASVTVNVGDKVGQGQQLVQYNTTVAQANYDTAVRNKNKIGRQINYLRTYGVSMPASETASEGAGASAATGPASTGYNQQLQDLNDSYADAQAEVDKAQLALNDTVVVSGVEGTVVEVNKDVDPSSKSSQTLVHVASEGQLQVKGSLTEYDLANIKVGQSVKIKSKVYSDKEWEGKISYISNYPSDNNAAAADSHSGPGASSASNYEYKVDITSPINELKQGFSVSVEVVNESKHELVPVNSVINEGKKHFVWLYDDSTGKVSKTEVTLGNADAKRQEIVSGLKVGQIVISNPDKHIKNDKKLDNVKSADTDTKGNKKESEVSK
ncbi:efflux RND transporter periplasmic adaptor subunit [Streptococcus didelphis]|uniref:efflux RND transporter periplasmic adaptor subunit n=1 Tax=Streptococcus didelphis TaxID=102886 RepID=UPI00036381F3|nr:efflux RND transporter periplasmic adaptor subunit [Streptococcus didelphis]WMB29020.1 efflux RND transporter periplasmic adaptor subunit [Streptococcus didelphis]